MTLTLRQVHEKSTVPAPFSDCPVFLLHSLGYWKVINCKVKQTWSLSLPAARSDTELWKPSLDKHFWKTGRMASVKWCSWWVAFRLDWLIAAVSVLRAAVTWDWFCGRGSRLILFLVMQSWTSDMEYQRAVTKEYERGSACDVGKQGHMSLFCASSAVSHCCQNKVLKMYVKPREHIWTRFFIFFTLLC